MSNPTSRKVPAGAEYDSIRALVRCLETLGMNSTRSTPERVFTAFSIPLLDAMTPIFSGSLDMDVIDRLKRVFPEWSTEQTRSAASFWFKSQGDRKLLYYSALDEQLPEDDADACEICHKIHPAGLNKKNATKPISKATASASSSSAKSSGPNAKKATSNKLPAKNRAIRSEDGKKKVPDFLDDDFDELDGSEEVEEPFVCQPCPLTGCKKRQKCSAVKYLRYGCLRKDLHGGDIMSLLDNDWEAQIKQLSQNVEGWAIEARAASHKFPSAAGSDKGTTNFASWFKQMCADEEDMAKLKFVAAEKFKSKGTNFDSNWNRLVFL